MLALSASAWIPCSGRKVCQRLSNRELGQLIQELVLQEASEVERSTKDAICRLERDHAIRIDLFQSYR